MVFEHRRFLCIGNKVSGLPPCHCAALLSLSYISFWPLGFLTLRNTRFLHPRSILILKFENIMTQSVSSYPRLPAVYGQDASQSTSLTQTSALKALDEYFFAPIIGLLTHPARPTDVDQLAFPMFIAVILVFVNLTALVHTVGFILIAAWLLYTMWLAYSATKKVVLSGLRWAGYQEQGGKSR
ncbi:hypothetical protein BDV96DRAFT_377642 [Lophiotrema nucula]|uniref:Uncharacterized protein n=1 Tax=Lophiotrema nucula TaxID=690887 RepID=A0A6A5ZF22_9PLEO|nr:hypothetical protein BDV96DRAFT_377642 [Lophiotrema nucula]